MNTEPDEREYPDPKKSKAGRKGGLKRQENWRKGVKECDTCGKLSADLNEHPCFIAAHNAATRMRERCVTRVREMRDEWKAEESSDLKYAVWGAGDIITALESLTLDGEKEQ